MLLVQQLRNISTRGISNMGFTKTILKEGNGPKPNRGQNVTVHCVSEMKFLFRLDIDS